MAGRTGLALFLLPRRAATLCVGLPAQIAIWSREREVKALILQADKICALPRELTI
jgi:hypothetical protein